MNSTTYNATSRAYLPSLRCTLQALSHALLQIHKTWTPSCWILGPLLLQFLKYKIIDIHVHVYCVKQLIVKIQFWHYEQYANVYFNIRRITCPLFYLHVYLCLYSPWPGSCVTFSSSSGATGTSALSITVLSPDGAGPVNTTHTCYTWWHSFLDCKVMQLVFISFWYLTLLWLERNLWYSRNCSFSKIVQLFISCKA